MDELLDDLQEIGQLPRLGDDVVQVAGVDRGDQLVGLGIPGDDRAPALRAKSRDVREQLGAGDARHAQIREHRDDVAVRFQHHERFLTVRGEQHVAARGEHAPERVQVLPIVVDADDDWLPWLSRSTSIGRVTTFNCQCDLSIKGSSSRLEP